MNIGNVHGSQGRYEEALVQYQKALEVFLAVYGSSEWDSTIYIIHTHIYICIIYMYIYVYIYINICVCVCVCVNMYYS